MFLVLCRRFLILCSLIYQHLELFFVLLNVLAYRLSWSSLSVFCSNAFQHCLIHFNRLLWKVRAMCTIDIFYPWVCIFLSTVCWRGCLLILLIQRITWHLCQKLGSCMWVTLLQNPLFYSTDVFIWYYTRTMKCFLQCFSSIIWDQVLSYLWIVLSA